jgi:hypothetical protein
VVFAPDGSLCVGETSRVKVSPGRKKVSIIVPNLKRGRVYELRS